MKKDIVLRPYQEDGVRFLDEVNGRGLLADDQGLGKTIQLIAWAASHPDRRPMVIVCPAYLKYNWQDEIKRFTGYDSSILFGRDPDWAQCGHDILILNYDILVAWWPLILEKMKPQILVGDEIQYIKGRKSGRSKAFVSFSRKIPHVIGLSGTPIETSPTDIWVFLNILDKKKYSSFWRFADQVSIVTKGHGGYKAKGAKDTQELHVILSTVMIRRRKADVLPDLPAKQRNVIPIELDNRREYETIRDDFKEWYKYNKYADAVEFTAQMAYLRQAIIKGKMLQAERWIRDFRESTNKPLVVFGVHREPLSILAKKFRANLIQGGVSVTNRNNWVKDFQKGKSSLLFGNLQAMGTGLTLTAASDMLMTELDYVPTRLLQAEDRIHRISQTRKVNIYYLLAKKTMEEHTLHFLKPLCFFDPILDAFSGGGFLQIFPCTKSPACPS
ncbi:MAG: DEAD/DEAH box helicase [Planctomycetota bacterium]